MAPPTATESLPCAVVGCSQAAVARDPRPTTVPACYYLCADHLAAVQNPVRVKRELLK